MYVKTAQMLLRWQVLVTLGIALALGSCKSRLPEGFRASDQIFVHEANGVDLRMWVRGADTSMAGLVEIVFDIAHPGDMDVTLAQAEDWCGELTLYSQIEEPGRLRDGGKRIERRISYSFEPDYAGDFEVDGIKVEYWPTRWPGQRQSFTTEPFSVQVHSLLTGAVGEDPNTADILDIEGLWMPPERKSSGVLVVLGLLGGAGVLVVYLWKRTPKQAVKRTVGAVPRPGEQALAELANLLDENLCEQGLFDRFFVRLADIMRRYSATSSCPVLAQTTEELLAAISLEQRFGPAHQDMLGRLLQNCDEAKFAGIGVCTEIARTRLEDCRCFIRQTAEVLA